MEFTYRKEMKKVNKSLSFGAGETISLYGSMSIRK